MKHKLLTLASAAVLFAACSDTAVSDANDEIKEKSTVTFFVRDVLTQMPLEDVANYYRTEDKTKYTDSTGTIVWKGVDLGDSYFDFQLDGYAMKRVNVGTSDDIENDIARTRDTTVKVDMYELGVTVKGKFYYRDPATKDWIPAANARIYIDYPDDSEIYPNEVYNFTKEDGSYEFTNLAANIDFDVKSERFMVDTVTYEVATIRVKEAQRKGVVKLLDPMVAEVASLEPKLLSSNLSSLGVKDAIKLNFSEVLDKDSLTTEYVYVERIVDDSDPTNIITKPVAVALSLADSGKTVVVKSQSGAWADGKGYFIYFDVWSTLAKELQDSVKINGVEYKKYRKFIAGDLAVPAKVKNLKVKKDDEGKKDLYSFEYKGSYTFKAALDEKLDLTYDATVTIQWDAIERNVDKYNIYVKGDKADDADYIKVGEVKATKTDVEDFSVNIAALYDDNFLMYPQNKFQSGEVSIMVLAENASGETLATEGAVLKDIKLFGKTKEDVVKMQTNGYISSPVVKLSALYECSDTKADFSGCGSVSHGSTISEDNYAADLIVTAEYDADKDAPDGYDLYYYSDADKKWNFVKSQAGATSFEFIIKREDDFSPFKNGPQPYDDTQKKIFKYAIVPYFGKVTPATPGIPGTPEVPAHCSDIAYDNQVDCEAAFETWYPLVPEVPAVPPTPEKIVWKISQTDSDADKGMFITTNNLQKNPANDGECIEKW